MKLWIVALEVMLIHKPLWRQRYILKTSLFRAGRGNHWSIYFFEIEVDHDVTVHGERYGAMFKN